jgi:hypothetical protein
MGIVSEQIVLGGVNGQMIAPFHYLQECLPTVQFVKVFLRILEITNKKNKLLRGRLWIIENMIVCSAFTMESVI